MTCARNDEGFSLLEVLFAAFIAFFMLTAIFGVIVTSAGQGRIAGSDTVSTNLAQLVVEQARALPYTSVGVTPTPAGDVPGVLLSTETTTYQGNTFTIKRDVTWVWDHLNPASTGQDYKKLVVSVSWTGGHATPAVTFIRDHTNETPTPPMVVWTNMVPPANSVLFDRKADGTYIGPLASVWNRSADPDGIAGLASLQASASVVTTTGAITRIEFQANGLALPSTFSGSAPIVPNWPSAGYSIRLGLTTDTPQPSTAYFREGLNTIKVVATANNLAYAYRILLVTVDNYAPEFKTGDAVTLIQPDDNRAKYASSLSMTWPVAMDGTDPAASYDMIVTPPSAYATRTIAFSSVNLGAKGAYTLGLASPTGFAPSPGMPYSVSLTPKSLRGLMGHSQAMSGYVCTSPRLDGQVWNLATQSFMPNVFEFHLNLTHENDAAILSVYPSGSSIVYDVISVNAATYPYPGAGNLTTATPGYVQTRRWDGVAPIAADVGTNSNSCYEYLQVDAKVMAADGVTVLAHIPSNVVGPPRNASGAYAPPAKGTTSKPSVPVDVTVP